MERAIVTHKNTAKKHTGIKLMKRLASVLPTGLDYNEKDSWFDASIIDPGNW